MEDPLTPLDTPKAVTDWKRERDVFNLYAAFQDIPRINNLGCSPDTHSFPADFVPKPASDASLAAFAQLAAIRLQAQRSMISLLDGEYQYILAEATPNTSLRFDSPFNKNLDILLGNVRIPRNWGLCERVLDPSALAEGEPGIIIIQDLSQSRLHENRSYVREGPKFRFYAGVPIRSPNGTIVGSMCIFDGPERNGVSKDDILYLQDLAATVMEYLVTYTIKDQHRRRTEGLHGLLSFAEGDSKLQSFKELYQQSGPSPKCHNSTANIAKITESKVNKQDVLEAVQDIQPKLPPVAAKLDAVERRNSLGDLQEKILPNTTRELFARAADIMRKSNDMDGVMFLDASVAATAYSGGKKTPTRGSGKKCQILGFATTDRSSLNNDSMPSEMIPDEAKLTWLLKQYPHGYSLDCEEEQAISWTNDGVPLVEPLSPVESSHKDQEDQESIDKRAQHVLSIKALFPNIKSALFSPLWDFERNRWFAGCFCWSKRAERNLSSPFELPFLKVFGHSIMREVARIDAMTTDQVKTSFLSSLSHELRSPLHGILGSIQLMRSTSLDSFQASMVNSIAVCGRTLLETVQHLLDHAERKEPGQNFSTKTSSGDNTVCITSESSVSCRSFGSNSAASHFSNLGLVTEEVVETMFLGQSRFDISLGGDDVPGAPIGRLSSKRIAQRRNRFVILDIKDYANLNFSIAASSYGRIVMNLLGNALKFTESGHILVSLQSTITETSEPCIMLKINDSGIGISKDFLLKEAFEPFRKQNQHSAGTGVGLSVVRRIIEDVGGSIEVQSEPNKGTTVTLRLTSEPLKIPEDTDDTHTTILATLSQLHGRKVCILHSRSPDEDSPDENVRHWQLMQRFIMALSSTLQDELGMIVAQTTDWDGHNDADIVICPEVSFESLHTIRNVSSRSPPATLFIAMDTIEAETLRCDARVTNNESVVEVMTQPCGPYKLGIALSQCLLRYDQIYSELTAKLEAKVHSTDSMNGFQLISELGPRLGLYPPLPFRPATTPVTENVPPMATTPPISDMSKVEPSNPQPDDCETVLIVDDNAINRRLLSAFMKKRKLPFREAHDGLQAVEAYQQAGGKFNLILMDISMPVMDGMTSTRLIREHENNHNLQPAHIIALTGLTSASAKLEAWTSGVDDFLTKPVDFKQLEKLMKAGRCGEGTGFLKEQSNQ